MRMKKKLKCNKAFFPSKLNFFSHRKEVFFYRVNPRQEISCHVFKAMTLTSLIKRSSFTTLKTRKLLCQVMSRRCIAQVSFQLESFALTGSYKRMKQKKNSISVKKSQNRSFTMCNIDFLSFSIFHDSHLPHNRVFFFKDFYCK